MFKSCCWDAKWYRRSINVDIDDFKLGDKKSEQINCSELKADLPSLTDIKSSRIDSTVDSAPLRFDSSTKLLLMTSNTAGQPLRRASPVCSKRALSVSRTTI
jgi:hypothetical protein